MNEPGPWVMQPHLSVRADSVEDFLSGRYSGVGNQDDERGCDMTDELQQRERVHCEGAVAVITGHNLDLLLRAPAVIDLLLRERAAVRAEHEEQVRSAHDAADVARENYDALQDARDRDYSRLHWARYTRLKLHRKYAELRAKYTRVRTAQWADRRAFQARIERLCEAVERVDREEGPRSHRTCTEAWQSMRDALAEVKP